MPTPVRHVDLLVGPYGDGWAWRAQCEWVNDYESEMLAHWYRAGTEADAVSDGCRKIRRVLHHGQAADIAVRHEEVPLEAPRLQQKATAWTYEDDQTFCGEAATIEIHGGGASPIQGTGRLEWIDRGLEFSVYFRARHRGWELEVTLGENETWIYREDHRWAEPDAGHLHPDVVRELIRQAVAAFFGRFGRFA